MRAPSLTFRLAALLGIAVAWAAPAHAEWQDVATISSTLGNNPYRLCVGGGGSDLGCPVGAPLLDMGNNRLTVPGDLRVVGNLLVSGTQSFDGVTFANGGVSATGTVTATGFVGDGSGITGIDFSVNPIDRIISGTAHVITSNNGTVSISGTTFLRGRLDIATYDNGGNLTNTLIGKDAGLANTSENVTAIGLSAAQNNASRDVVAIGPNAAKDNGNSSYQVVAIGTNAAQTNTGYDVNAIGANAATTNSGYSVNAFGPEAALQNSGYHVNAFGPRAARLNTGGNVNALGFQAAGNNTGQDVNAFGLYAAEYNTGQYVIAMGTSAATSNQQMGTIALGRQALTRNTTGLANTAVGYRSMLYTVTGSYNTALGYSAGVGVNANSFSANTLLGAYAGTALSTGSSNTIVGANSGMNLTTGSRNILIGAGVTPISPTADGQLSIGNAIFGDINSGLGYANRIGINVAVPTTALHVSGTLRIADGAEQCDTDRTGAIKYQANKFFICQNGTTWEQLATTSSNTLVSINTGLSGSIVFRDELGYLKARNDLSISATTGSVGIGAGAPSWVGSNGLYAAGGIYAGQGLSTDSGKYLSWGNTEYMVGDNTDHHIRMATNNAERLRITSNGYVGIGTSVPSSTLHVYSDTYNDIPFMVRARQTYGMEIIGAEGPTGLVLSTELNGTPEPQAAIETLDGQYGLALKYRNGGSMRNGIVLNNAGWVGMNGVYTPSTSLHINGALRLANDGVQSCDADRTGAIKYENNSFWVCQTPANGWEAMATTGANSLADRITSGTTQVITRRDTSITLATAGVERVVVGTNGNVGIGQQPGVGYALAISGATVVGSSNGAESYLNGPAGSFRYLGYLSSGVKRWDVGIDQTAESGSNAGSDFYINRFADNGSFLNTALAINRANGNVGIGTSNFSAVAQLVVSTTANGFSDGIISYANDKSNGESQFTALGTTASLRLAAQSHLNSFNLLVQQNDARITFANGARDTGGLVIAPWSASTNGLRMDNLGRIALGKVTPTTALDVSGTLRMSSGAEACDADRTGAIKFESGQFQVCRNGTSWETLVAGSSGTMDTDRITSGTTAVVANTNGNTVSITTGGTTTAYFHGTLGLVTPGVSATGTVSSADVNTGRVVLRGMAGGAGISLTNPGDNLGNHTATQTLDMAGQTIANAAKVTIGPMTTNTNVLSIRSFTDAVISDITRPSGYSGYLVFGTYTGAGVPSRWGVGVNNMAEGGSNTGSNFGINRHDDAGTYIDTPFYIDRQSGRIQVQNVSSTGNIQANQFIGDGSGLTNITASNISGLSTDRITSGTSHVMAFDNGTVNISGTTYIGYNTGTFASLEIGGGAIANRAAYLDLVGDTTYFDYGLRIMRRHTGPNTDSDLIHRGTGTLSFRTSESAPMAFFTTNEERMRITANGKIGIGLTNPGYDFEVSGTSRFRNGSVLISNTGITMSLSSYGTFGSLEAFDSNDSNIKKPLILNRWGGNVGIKGIDTPSTSLHVAGSLRLAAETSTTLQTCDANRTGAIKFESGQFQICRNGTTWETLVAGAGGSVNLSETIAINDLTDGRSSVASGTVYLGNNSGKDATTATSNTAVGINALASTTTGTGNTAVGTHAARNTAGGAYNTAMGSYALAGNNSGSNNTAVGYRTLVNGNTDANTAVGFEALAPTVSSNNTAVGFRTLWSNTTGYYNTAIGDQAGLWNNGGYLNTLVGSLSLRQNTVGSENTSIGAQALYNATGSGNTAVGVLVGTNLTTGISNTLLGHSAGMGLVTGSNSIMIGANTIASGSTSYQLNIGNAIWGNIASGIGNANRIGINVPSATTALEVSGTVSATRFVGDGSGLTNLAVSGDRITSGTTGMYTYNNTSATIATAGVERLIVGTDGRVGIGQQPTTGRALSVSGSVAIATGYGALNSGLAIGGLGDSPNMGSIAWGDNSGWKLNFGTGIAGVFTPRVTFMDTGNVGIGTTSPSETLHVVGRGMFSNAVGDAGIVINKSTANYGTIYFAKDNSARWAFAHNTGAETGTREGGDFTLNVYDNAGAWLSSPIYVERATGNVGLSRVPTTNLSLAGSIRIAAETSTTLNTCDTNRTGAIKFESGQFQVCRNGTTWETLVAGSGPSGTVAMAIDDLSDGASNPTSGTVFLGTNSGNSSTGTYNTALGINAMASNTTAARGVAIGYSALSKNQTGNANIAIGYQALTNNTTGTYNTGVGYQALTTNTGGSHNAAFGVGALINNTTGVQNAAFGNSALGSAVGSSNAAMGIGALNAGEVSASVALGAYAGAGSVISNHNNNVFVGYSAGRGITTGSGNAFVGAESGRATTSGVYNATLGQQTLYSNTTGGGNVALGWSALFVNTTGGSNLAMGSGALGQNITGNYNIGIGEGAGTGQESGTYNIYLGMNTFAPTNATSRFLNIGNSIFGDLSSVGAPSDHTGTNAKIGINWVTPTVALEVSGTVSSTNAYTGILTLRAVSGSAGVSLSSAGDNLGNHTATQNLDMAGFSIVNAGNLTTDRITSGTTGMYAYNNTSATIATAGVERIVIGTDGRVGIGSQPHASAGLLISGSQVTHGRIGITSFSSPTQQLGALTLGGDTTYNWIQSFNGLPLILNPLSNNVGIGTTTPNHILTVSSTGNSTIFNMGSTAGVLGLARNYANTNPAKEDILGIIGFSGEYTNMGLASSAASILTYVDNTGGSRIKGRLAFTTSDGVNLLERMRITSAGLIGIGTITPTTALEVSGTISGTTLFTPLLTLQGVSSSAGISMTSGGGSDNLGNHTATQSLNMAGNSIVSATNIAATGSVQAGNADTVCSSTTDYGKMRFNPATKKMFMCRP